ncbi:hypothetical protein IFM89_020267 [Coptis chinensis]|uniref:Uncharacterized protein n=1 Tax=Coptis chinensis TaxID=261450 RepID=A0A835HLD9_9MAGN|nr:hypothetical protein IFM89_020267 [Coptis chinensis]
MEPATTISKDLLDIEKKNTTSSSLESSLLVCKKDSLPQNPKPQTCSGKLVTTSVAESQVLGKVKDFLGVMAEANARLQHDAKEKSCMEYDIEALTGNETEYIEMDLALGVADLHTPEAVAAAEFAMAGSHSVIALPTTCCSGSENETSDDDINNNNVGEANSTSCSLNKPKKSMSEKDAVVSNGQLKKRQKIIELL